MALRRYLRGPGATGLRLVVWALVCSAAPVDTLATETGAGPTGAAGVMLEVDGRTVVSRQPRTSFVPASTIKLAAALVALETLGPEFHFHTDFYRRGSRQLVIKGYGDPFLVSEYVDRIASDLRRSGVSGISSLILDESYFALEGAVDGSSTTANPYDAVNSALSVNFGSLPLHKHIHGRVTPAEPQTPLIPLMEEIGRSLEPGNHRVNVDAFPRVGAISNRLRYVAELFSAGLRRAGVGTVTEFSAGKAGSGDTPVYRFISPKTLASIVHDCLRYSNNFIANQLVLAAGIERGGAPATWAKARRTLHDVLHDSLGLPEQGVTLVEGAGLSRKNRVTPLFMIALLHRFKPYADLLEKRSDTLLKSGTLEGVYCYAGYFTSSGRLDPFVIMLNQRQNTRDTLLRQLQQLHLASLKPGKAATRP